MRDSLMLTSLTVGEKQHPYKLGGCVRIFLKLFDWNRKLSCKKRFFMQLPAERVIRRDDGHGDVSLVSGPPEDKLFITDGNELEEDSLPNLDSSSDSSMNHEEEEEVAEEDVVHDLITDMAINGGIPAMEIIQQGRSPGVIGRLMGLESFPCPDNGWYESPSSVSDMFSGDNPSAAFGKLALKMKVDDQPATARRCSTTINSLVAENGLPGEELDALINELNGNMGTILSLWPIVTAHNMERKAVNDIRRAPLPRSARIDLNSGCRHRPATSSSRASHVLASNSSVATWRPHNDQAAVKRVSDYGQPWRNSRTQLEGVNQSLKSSSHVCVSRIVPGCDQQICTVETVEGNVGTHFIHKGDKKLSKGTTFSYGDGRHLAGKRVGHPEKELNARSNEGPGQRCNNNYDKKLAANGRSTCTNLGSRRKKVDESKGPSVRALVDDQLSCSGAWQQEDVGDDDGEFVIRYRSGPSSDYRRRSSMSNEQEIVEKIGKSVTKSEIRAGSAKDEEFSLMRTLVNKRAAREAAQAAAKMEMEGAADTIHLPVEGINMEEFDDHDEQFMKSITHQNIDPTDTLHRREKVSAGRSELAGGGSGSSGMLSLITCDPAQSGGQLMMRAPAGVGDRSRRRSVIQCSDASDSLGILDDMGGHNVGRAAPSCSSYAHTRCVEAMEVSFNNGNAAKLQDVIYALDGSSSPSSATLYCSSGTCTPHTTPASSRLTPHDMDSTTDGHETESTSDSVCWAAASQPSPVSVLISPFDEADASPAAAASLHHQEPWIRSEEEYVTAVLVAAAAAGGAEAALLFSKLEERVAVAGWQESEVLSTRSYRRLVFDCVVEATGESREYYHGQGQEYWERQARLRFDDMCRWRKSCDTVLDDLVEADFARPCNGWTCFELEAGDLARLLEHTLCGLLVEELVCDLVLG